METKQMTAYKSKSGKRSGVMAYEISENAIAIQFSDGKGYVYTYASAGHKAVDAMKKCALRSDGLNRCLYKYRPEYAEAF